MKNFSLKFIDIMVGIILGLGFQWWPDLHFHWQYVAFVFVYFDIIDYWIDYAPSLKKFPPKREIDVLLDLAIMFILFLYIYAVTLTLFHLLGAFVIFKIFDYLWLFSSRHEYHPTGTDKLFVDTWMKFNVMEAILTGILIGGMFLFTLQPLVVLIIFIVVRITIRVIASFRYKKVHFS